MQGQNDLCPLRSSIMGIKEDIIAAVDEISEPIKEIARYIHSNPETGFSEQKAAEALIKFLEDEGLEVEKGSAGLETAFVARKGDGSGPKIATLAEYDALPGLGHGCGHNLIGTSACAAAAGVVRALGDIKGEILCIGTPAEEGGGGKIIMANKGLFDGLDAVMLAHPSNVNEVFKLALGVIQVTVVFHGKSAHAAAWPHHGVNALDAMILLFSGINALRQQFPPYARVHGIITHGGDAPNIIPDRTEATFLVRALRRTTLDRLMGKVKDVAEGAAKSTGCQFDWKPVDEIAYAPFQFNRTLGSVYLESMKEMGIEDEQGPEDRGLGSSDIGNVGERAPTIHPEFRIGPNNIVHHTEGFRDQAASDEGLDAMVSTAKAMALTAAKLFQNQDLIKEIRAEFEQS